MTRRLLAASAAAALVVLAFTLARAGDPSPDDLYKQGNKFYDEKTYKKALEAFLQLRKAAPDFVEKDDVALKIAVSHARLRQWDEAEAAYKEAAKGADHHKLRALVLLGQLYRDWPHELYVKGEERKRGEWIEGGEYRWTQQEDSDNCLRCFEEAKKVSYELRDLYAAALATNPKNADEVEKKDRTVRSLSADLNFELAAFVADSMGRRTTGERWKDPAPGAKRYDPSWTPNEKCVFLYDEVLRLDPDDEKKGRSAAALREKAMLIMRRPWIWGRKPEDDFLGEAAAILRTAVKDYPKSGIADQLQYMIARAFEDSGRFVEAIEEFQKVLDHKDSKWVSDAKYRIQEAERPRLQLSGAANWVPGQEVQVTVSHRNVKSVALKVQAFDLEKAWEVFVERSQKDHGIGDFASEAANRASNELAGKEVASWTLDAEDDGKHTPAGHPVKVPVKEAGAYLLTAEANGIVSRVVLVVSDVVLVEQIGGREATYYVAEAESGKPVEGVEVRVLERVSWWDGGQNRIEDHKYTKKTGADGLATVELSGGTRGSQVAAIAKRGGKPAIAHSRYNSYYGEGSRQARVDVFTERPVYRPSQDVNFKVTLREPTASGYRVPSERKLHVKITDPKGNDIYKQFLTANDNGSASGSVKLGEEPPLGQYSIQVQCGNINGWFAFRCEEYKKPEVLVEIVSKTELAKLGDGLTAEIQATYFFGGGVPDADVHYTVTRRDFRFWWHEAEEFDWYYGDRWGRPYRDWNQEVVLDGTGKTDAEGKLLIEWSTLKAKEQLGDRDHEYEIHATVTDKSRRTVEGDGSVRVTRTQMFATLASRRGFYVAGDHVEVEVSTQNANNSPLESDGSMTVARVVWDASAPNGGAWKDEPFYTEPLKTGKDGRGFFKWQADRDGHYAFVFESKDAWGEKVTGRTAVNVADPNKTDSTTRFAALNLSPERRTYRPGDTAKVLLWSDTPGASVLVTFEANQKVLSREVIALKGKARVIEIPLEERHTPNFFIRATAVGKGLVQQSWTEIFVPPADKFLDVTVTPSRAEYKPGEKARVDVSVKDWKGSPAAAELALWAIDKSVLSIAPMRIGDNRLMFWGGRRYMNVQVVTSREYGTSPVTTDSNTYPKHKLHGDPFGWYSGGGGRFGGRRGRQHGEGGAWGAANDQGFAPELSTGDVAREEPDHNEAEGGEEKELGKKAESQNGLLKDKADAPAAPPKPAGDPGATGDTGPGKAPVVRKNFADTAVWSPFVTTGADGKGSIEFDMPDSLTAWRITARAIDGATRVGSSGGEVVTRKTLMARLQAPRFFRERDELILSAIVNNAAKIDEQVAASLTVEGGTLEIAEPNFDKADKHTIDVAVAAGGEVRVDWKVKAVKEGMARVIVTAIGKEDSDAMQLDFPVYVHGMDKQIGWGGVVRADEESATFTIEVPAERKISTADLVVNVSPTMMGAVLDSLPYLIDYPYGCVEQTMSRFLPAVAVAKALRDSGISLEDVGKRRRAAYADLPPSKDPVFHTQALKHVVEAGLERLYGFQNGSGGWGWWNEDRMDAFITAYVVNGLRVAKLAGAPVDEGRFQNGVNALKRSLEKEEDLHRATYCAYVLAECGALDDKPIEHLYTRRGDMNSYGRALLAMALHLKGKKEKAEVAIRNMEDFVNADEKHGISYWKREDRWAWWYWYGDDVEANAAILRAYLMIDPKNAHVNGLAKWLLTNREGGRWKSTRDTAHAVLALVEYARKAGELEADYTAEISLDGKLLKKFEVSADNVFTLDGDAALRGDAVETGKHTITIMKKGKGTAYWSAYLKYFTTEEDLKGGSSRLTVKRDFYKLTQRVVESNDRGRKIKKIEFDRTPLQTGATVTSGDLLEIEFTVDAPNDYEYLAFEDFRAAGTEATEVLSGYVWGRFGMYQEFRDERAVFFVNWMPRGTHKWSYRVRAEIPGHYHAMPTNGYAMYAPSVKGISDEFRLIIVDKPKDGSTK